MRLQPGTRALEFVAACLVFACSGTGQGNDPSATSLEALDGAAPWTFVGEQAAERLGYSVASAGDVNGDGYSDFIVGAPHHDGLGAETGRALLFLGSPTGPEETPIWIAEGDEGGSRFGIAVASAGDVNGDGFSDVVVGADYAGRSESSGRAYLYLGSRRGLGEKPSWIGQTSDPDAGFGNSVASAGDVNDDGYGDVIVGAWHYDEGTVHGGAAYVFLGSSDGLAENPAWMGSQALPSLFGTSVASAGDVNGDGYSDVIVGASAYGSGGLAFVYHGSENGVSTTADWQGGYGYSVAGAGDVNGDGFDDVVVGSPGLSGGSAAVHLGSASGLATLAAWSESGIGTGQFGWSVTSVGDVNADGFSDIAIGAPTDGTGGKMFVYPGSASGPLHTKLWTGASTVSRARYGASVASAGDVNGDGFADIVVGAAYEVDHLQKGSVLVYLGPGLDPLPPDLPAVPLAPDWIGPGIQESAAFAHAVASAGDVNGDGYDDIIVGAPHHDGGSSRGDPTARKDEGRAFLYLGSPTGLSSRPAWIGALAAGQGFARYGFSVGGVGDVNGDGFDDVLVGAPSFGDGEPGEGRAFLYFGCRAGLTTAPVWTLDTNQAHSNFGESVSGAGDVNGDGYADAIVGAPGYDRDQPDEGFAYVYFGSASGLSAAPAWMLESDQPKSMFGHSARSAGDVNGDGFSDIVVGAYLFDAGRTDEGRAFVYLGSGSGLSSTPAWSAGSDQLDARFGYSVAGSGDVNDDGFSDVVVGAYLLDHHEKDEGRVLVYFGSLAGLGVAPAWMAESHQVGAYFGHSVASIGDMNGDGFSDLVVGAPAYSNGEQGEGRAFVYHGAQRGLGRTPAGIAEINQPLAAFGYSVAGAGDLNRDGFSDLIVGAPAHRGKGSAFVYYGSASNDDSDDDGTPDPSDGCDADPNKIVPGVCGCGRVDADADGDRVMDCVDRCPMLFASTAGDGCPAGGGGGGSSGSGGSGGAVGGTGGGGNGSGGGVVGGTGGSGGGGGTVGGTGSGGSGSAGTGSAGTGSAGTGSAGTGSGGSGSGGGDVGGGGAVGGVGGVISEPGNVGGTVSVTAPPELVANGRLDIGCGCRIGATSVAGSAWQLALAALGLAALRRRRRARYS